MLPTPLVLLRRASAPLAVFAQPMVLLNNANVPVAVFASLLFARSAPDPIAVL